MLNIVDRQVPHASLPFDGLDDVPEERHISPGVRLQFHLNHFVKIAGNCPLDFRPCLM